MLGAHASRYALIAARWAARVVRPLERLALGSLRLFMTPRGPMLFLASMALLIGALIALIAMAPGPGPAAWTKLALGLLSFALFGGYLRAFFAVRSENEAALAGLRPEHGGGDMEGAPRDPDLLSASDLVLFLFGLMTAHTAVAAALLEGGFGPQALDASGAATLPSAADWAIYALWASLGAVDLLGLLPRPGEAVFSLRIEWGWAVLWLYLYRLALLGVLFSLAANIFDARRKTAIALARAGMWPEKRLHIDRLGRGGLASLAASLSVPDAERRADAARMLGAATAYPQEATRALTTALADASEAVRERAAESLGVLGSAAAESSPALIGKLLDASRAVRRQAAAALGAVASDRADIAYPAMAALAQAIPQEPAQIETADPLTLAALAGSLAKVASAVGDASDPAIAAVDRLRGHRDALVRQTAAEAYGRLMSAAQARAQAEAERRAAAEAAAREAEWSRNEWPPRTDWAR